MVLIKNGILLKIFYPSLSSMSARGTVLRDFLLFLCLSPVLNILVGHFTLTLKRLGLVHFKVTKVKRKGTFECITTNLYIFEYITTNLFSYLVLVPVHGSVVLGPNKTQMVYQMKVSPFMGSD